MNENEYLAQVIGEQLARGAPLTLVSLASLTGSTPRHSGTKMVVGADGRNYGTIGGSLLEATAIREARRAITGAQSRLLSFELSGENANAPGMICGGRAELLLDYIAATPANREFFAGFGEELKRGADFYFLTPYREAGDGVEVLGHAILHPDGSFSGDARLTGADISELRPELHNISGSALLTIGDRQVLVDRIRKLKTLYCFGAGHVAVPTAHLAALVGFRIVVIDDRPDFANAERFPEATPVVIDDFERALEGLEIDEDSFIVIVTRGHEYDQTILRQALATPAGYIGMISSRHKRDITYQALMAEGIKKERLDEVHSPIGLDIGGETPEEIAVSIVAELIQVRSRLQP